MRNVGDMVGGLALTRRVGEGPFGVVWLAYDAHRVPVAAKFMRESFVKRRPGQAAFTRLLGSIRAYKSLEHPGIARVWGGLEVPEADALGMVSEYIDGRTLSEVHLPASLQDGRERRALGTLVGWFADLCDTLAWLHSNGIVHGNLKPSNVMLERGEVGHTVRVLDLAWSAIGLAAPVPGEATYLAPEQVMGQPPSAASDQWTVGTMLARILSQDPSDPSLTNLPFSLVNAADQATRRSPLERYPSVADLAAILRQVHRELVPDLTAPSSSSHPGFNTGIPAAAPPVSAPEPTLPGGQQSVDDGVFPAQVPLRRAASLPPVPDARPLTIPDEDSNSAAAAAAMAMAAQDEPAIDFSAINAGELDGFEPTLGEGGQDLEHDRRPRQATGGDKVGPLGMALGAVVILALAAVVAFALYEQDPDAVVQPSDAGVAPPPPATEVAPPKSEATPPPSPVPAPVTPPPPPAPTPKKAVAKPPAKPAKAPRPAKPKAPEPDLDKALKRLEKLPTAPAAPKEEVEEAEPEEPGIDDPELDESDEEPAPKPEEAEPEPEPAPPVDKPQPKTVEPKAKPIEEPGSDLKGLAPPPPDSDEEEGL